MPVAERPDHRHGLTDCMLAAQLAASRYEHRTQVLSGTSIDVGIGTRHKDLIMSLAIDATPDMNSATVPIHALIDEEYKEITIFLKTRNFITSADHGQKSTYSYFFILC